MHYLVQPNPSHTLLYSAYSALSCSALHWSVLFCSVLLCYCIVLFCFRIMKKKKWSRTYHTDSKLVSEYVPLVPDQSQLTRSHPHSEYNSTDPRLVSSSTDSKSISECVPLVPDQTQPTQSQHHSRYHSYHWSQTSITVSESVTLVPDQSQPTWSQCHSMYHSDWSQTSTALTQS